MTRQLSFSKYEQAILPGFRERINQAESTEDVKKFFGQTTDELMKNAFQGSLATAWNDITLDEKAEGGFAVSGRLLASEEFTSVWNSSDLPNVVSRFAKTAMNHYKHLLKHPEKTNAKIRM
ncbi:MAG: hypothetical protein ACOY3Z_02965 [Thermodesulfobacteriota bacterium]